jgi:two-component system phosphate regulon sensor histidine kinase PhoR
MFPIASGIVLFSTVTIGILTFRYVAEKESLLGITLLQSNLSLVRQTLNRIELGISAQDQKLYAFLNSISLEELQLRLGSASVTPEPLVRQLYLVDDEWNVHFPPDRQREHARWIRRKVLTNTEPFQLPLLSILHLHTTIDGEYHLFSLLPFTLAGDERRYLLVQEFRSGDLAAFFDPYLRDLERNYVVCIRDYENKLIFGTPFQVSRKYFVEQRFPNTFYKWLFQLAPRNADQLEQEALTIRSQNILLLAINLVLILSAWFLVYVSRREEQKLTQQKEAFIRNVSHELKTPLALIKMFSEILLMGRGRDETTRQEYLSVIFAETERMTHLINNVLDFANLEGGLQKFSFEELALDRVVARHLEAFDYRMRKEKVDLQVEAEPGLPPIRGDANALALILLNLLDNAIKYSSDRSRQIRIRIFHEPPHVCLKIRDQGIGIAPEDLPRIFDKFYRSNNIAVRRVRGSGIGLSLVKYLVDAHGGEIHVESSVGEGSVFTIRFPARVDAAPPAGGRGPDSPMP